MSTYRVPDNPHHIPGICNCGCGASVTPGHRFRQGHGSRRRYNLLGTPEERFWPRVLQTDTCWLWQGARRHKSGYGGITVYGRYMHAHRYAYELFYGPILPGIDVCHHCDTPACVRPDHLFLGSHSDNMRDAAKKGRNGRQRYPPQGEAHPQAKLTEAQVQEIRHLQGILSSNKVGKLFSLSRTTVKHIWKRRLWKHLL